MVRAPFLYSGCCGIFHWIPMWREFQYQLSVEFYDAHFGENFMLTACKSCSSLFFCSSIWTTSKYFRCCAFIQIKNHRAMACSDIFVQLVSEQLRPGCLHGRPDLTVLDDITFCLQVFFLYFFQIFQHFWNRVSKLFC